MKRELMERLYPLNRTLSSDDTDKAFEIIREYIPLKYHDFPSGEKVFTWRVPDRWHVESAVVLDEEGNKILDYKDHPLHLCSYSLPFTGWVTKKELCDHISTNEELPDAIPFEHKYYERDWHLCLQHNKFIQLKKNKFFVDIKTSFEKKYLRVGEYTIKGKKDDTILLIANICHPFQVNDSISGLVALASLMRDIAKEENNFTYKLLICPEVIGSTCYFSKFQSLIPTFKWAIFSEMLGIDQKFRLKQSKYPESKINLIAEYVLKKSGFNHEIVHYRNGPSNDEKVSNSPGIEIETISLIRWPYKEYHTSADSPDLISDEKMDEAENILKEIIYIIDNDFIPQRKFTGLLSLSENNLWVDHRIDSALNKNITTILLNLDNKQTIFDICNQFQIDFKMVFQFCIKLRENQLII